MIDKDLLCILVDAMIPGHDNRWPAASDVIDAASMARALSQELPPDALALLAGGRQDPDAALAGLAARLPRSADRLAEAVYRAYYTAPSVQAAIREIAESGPREPSTDFDETMLDAVRRRDGGPWRS
jgi:hypothetical protein